MRAAILGSLLALLWATTASADDVPFKVSQVVFAAAQGADLASGEHAIGRGLASESNPYLGSFQNAAVRGAVKMGTAGIAQWLTAKLHRTHPVAARRVNFITSAVLMSVAVHNMRVAR